MPLPPGTLLGPYTIVGPLGAGGMGEVYRARDTRLDREVAIKTLPESFAADSERRARFEDEARAVAALSHPNVLAIHDVGNTGSITYAVTELVEGETLRDRLRSGPVPAARAIALAIQVAHGLAAAHDRGIVHRDLKPENLMITPEGRVKILDFGLARRDRNAALEEATQAPTIAVATEPGVVLGTVAYMSPEQVRAQRVDASSDIFALGSVMYEMISGTRPFSGGTAAEVMSAILRDDPIALTRAVREVSPALDAIVLRCLEKAPAARFRSAADLAFALEAVATLPSGFHETQAEREPAAGGPRFKRITFRNGVVGNARFIPGSAGIVFGASWEGRPFEIFTAHAGSPEARSLGLPPANLLSISATGEMAISLGYRHMFSNNVFGTLARNALGGGGVRPLHKDVGHADWSADGRTLAVVRYVDSRCRLEWPAGTVRFETADWLSRPRIARDGNRVAYAYHPIHGDTQGEVWVVDAEDNRRKLLEDMTSISGIGWSPSGDQVWCSGINADQQNGIWAMSLDGRQRELYTSPGRVWLHDVAPDGRALIGLGNLRLGISASIAENQPEIDLSWFDGTLATDLSVDGRQVLLSEAHEAENPHYASYLRGIDGSVAVRLGEGLSARFSPDAQWALAITMRPPQRVAMYPTGLGDSRFVPTLGIERLAWAAFHPDGQHVFVVGSEQGREDHLFLASIDGGTPERLCDEPLASSRIYGFAISPGGDRLVFRRAGGTFRVLRLDSGIVEPVPVLDVEDTVVRFDASGRSLFVGRGDTSDFRVERVDLETGERTRWRTLAPADRTGILYMAPPAVSGDAQVIAYTYCRLLGDLYLVEGLG